MSHTFLKMNCPPMPIANNDQEIHSFLAKCLPPFFDHLVFSLMKKRMSAVVKSLARVIQLMTGNQEL